MSNVANGARTAYRALNTMIETCMKGRGVSVNPTIMKIVFDNLNEYPFSKRDLEIEDNLIDLAVTAHQFCNNIKGAEKELEILSLIIKGLEESLKGLKNDNE